MGEPSAGMNLYRTAGRASAQVGSPDPTESDVLALSFQVAVGDKFRQGLPKGDREIAAVI